MERYKTLSGYKTPGPKVRVGADIDSWCTRCRMVLTHTIMAMKAGEPVKVQCNTCGSPHKYREGPPGQKRARSTSRTKKPSGTWAPSPPKRPASAWLEATAGKDLGSPIAYDPKSTFDLGQVIIHARFGTGVVMGVKQGGKIIVVFEEYTKVLVHGR